MHKFSRSILLLTLGTACTQLDPGSDTYHSVNQWRCIDEQTMPVTVTPARVKYSIPIVDFNSQPSAPTPVVGLGIKVCTNQRCDPEYPICASDSQQQCVRISGGPVQYVFDFPYGLANGWLQLSAPDYTNMDYILGGPMIGKPDGSLEVTGNVATMVPVTTLEDIYRSVGVDHVDPERGTLAIRILDCLGIRAPGMLLSTVVEDPGSVAFSLSNGNIATPNTLETDPRGVAGIVNLAPQAVDVIAITPDGRDYGGPTTINVRPNTITLAELRDGLDVWGQ
jgi:hypothetical protein